jgi:transposase-like protein
MPVSKLLVCPECKSKNVTWQGFDGEPPEQPANDAAQAPAARAVKWVCKDCGHTFTRDQAPPAPGYPGRRS